MNLIDKLQFLSRITELKQQLKKLEASDYQFLNNGLIQIKMTTLDVEINDVHPKVERSEEMDAMIEDAFKRDAERRRLIGKKSKKIVVIETHETR